MHQKALVLASTSPRRHEILKQLHIPHSVLHVPAPEGEDEPQEPGESPEAYVRRTAHDKVLRAADWLRRSPAASTSTSEPAPTSSSVTTEIYLLSADTVVILDGEILGKPLDHADAANTLRRLSGNVHHVHTALALHHDEQVFEALSISTVHFKNLSDAEITRYCETGDPMGKAGAYGIQGPAAAFISHLAGSYTGVMGLPAFETTELLAAAGWHTPSR